MDLHSDLEIFIPLEAEVKIVPLDSLRKSVLRQINISVSNYKGPGSLADLQEVIWICPVVLRNKGQKAVTQTLNTVKENMTSLFDASCHTATRSLQVPFFSANHTAYEVLKETLPGTKVSHTEHTSQIPRESAQLVHQDALVIYHKCIFLSIERPGKKRKTRHPQLATQSSTPSASTQSHAKKTKKNVEDQQRQSETVKKKRWHTDMLLRDPVLQGNKTSICTRALNENEDICDNSGDASSSKTVWSVPHSTDSIQSMDKLQRQANLKPAGFLSVRDQEQNEEEEPDKHCGDHYMCELPDKSNNNVNTYVHFSNFDQGEDQSWSRVGSTLPLQEEDFEVLKQDEVIARMEAKLKEREAALNSLHTLK